MASVHEVGSFELDPSEHQLLPKNHPVSLTPRAVKLLSASVTCHGPPLLLDIAAAISAALRVATVRLSAIPTGLVLAGAAPLTFRGSPGERRLCVRTVRSPPSRAGCSDKALPSRSSRKPSTARYRRGTSCAGGERQPSGGRRVGQWRHATARNRDGPDGQSIAPREVLPTARANSDRVELPVIGRVRIRRWRITGGERVLDGPVQGRLADLPLLVRRVLVVFACRHGGPRSRWTQPRLSPGPRRRPDEVAGQCRGEKRCDVSLSGRTIHTRRTRRGQHQMAPLGVADDFSTAPLPMGHDTATVLTGHLEEHGSASHAVYLREGQTYTIDLTCDLDCTDVDVRLSDGRGALIADDRALHDAPTISVDPTTVGDVPDRRSRARVCR
jgi:hypothetical protein